MFLSHCCLPPIAALLKGLGKIPLKSKGILDLCLEANFETSLEEWYSILHKKTLFKAIAIVTSHFKAETGALLLLGRVFLFGLSTVLPFE